MCITPQECVVTHHMTNTRPHIATVHQIIRLHWAMVMTMPIQGWVVDAMQHFMHKRVILRKQCGSAQQQSAIQHCLWGQTSMFWPNAKLIGFQQPELGLQLYRCKLCRCNGHPFPSFARSAGLREAQACARLARLARGTHACARAQCASHHKSVW